MLGIKAVTVTRPWGLDVAAPHSTDPDHRGRKVPRRWTVVVQWTKEGFTIDGPGNVTIDIEAGTATLES